jgi:predicted LPLAT superfamily acyltransferase
MRTWSARAERGSTSLIQFIAWLARKAGRPFCRALLYPVVLYFMLTDRAARHASAEFLQRAHGRPARTSQVFAHLYSFAATLLDRVYMARGELHRFEITIENQDLVSRTLQLGRGCVLLGSHLGSFDFMALATHALDPKPALSIMMRVDPRSRLRRIAGIDDSMLSIIPLGRPDSFLKAYDIVTGGAMVAVLADRVESAASLPVRFLDRMTTMPIAPYILAARCAAPAIICFGLYEGGNRYRIKFIEAGSTASVTSRGDELRPMVENYAAVLEQHARLYPLNWFNFYRYWDKREDRT